MPFTIRKKYLKFIDDSEIGQVHRKLTLVNNLKTIFNNQAKYRTGSTFIILNYIAKKIN